MDAACRTSPGFVVTSQNPGVYGQQGRWAGQWNVQSALRNRSPVYKQRALYRGRELGPIHHPRTTVIGVDQERNLSEPHY